MSHMREAPALSSCWEPPACGETPCPTLSVGGPCPGTPKEKVGSDHRSVYVGNVSPRGNKMGPLKWAPMVSHLLLAWKIRERDTGPGGEEPEDRT